MPVGNITRGTTNTNRLRRVDRWITALPALRSTQAPVIVDLGYGANASTPLELITRVWEKFPEAQLVGIEIDPERVARAQQDQRRFFDDSQITKEQHSRISFIRGGFETPLPGTSKATIIRAFNVLRQYEEKDVAAAWKLMIAQLQPQGVLVEGTCDEIGRVSSWIALNNAGPQTFSVSLKLSNLEKPSIVAERLPKALIHRNIPGENIHSFLTELDKYWDLHAPLSTFGPSQRWIATAQSMKDAGWPIQSGKTRWKLGELTVSYDAVAPKTKAV